MQALESLADPMRLRLVGILQESELSVNELCEVLGTAQSTASRHIKVLSAGGWLACRREGTSRHYRLADPLDTMQRHLLELARERLAAWPRAGEDARRLTAVLRKRDVKGFFAEAASDWARWREEVYGRLFHSEALLALLPQDWHVADLGCATGELTVQLARHVKGVVAVDVMDDMVEAVRARTTGQAHVQVVQADLAALPLKEGELDAALCVLVLSYLADPQAVLAEAARVLRPGGVLVAVDLEAHQNEAFRQQMGQLQKGFVAADLKAQLVAAGFSDVQVRPIPPDLDARGPALLLARAVK